MFIRVLGGKYGGIELKYLWNMYTYIYTHRDSSFSCWGCYYSGGVLIIASMETSTTFDSPIMRSKMECI